MRSIFLAALLCSVAMGFKLLGPTWKADKASSYLSYSAHHKLHSWTGTNKNVECMAVTDETTHQITKVAVVANVADFDSQNASRDSHALEVLDGVTHPKVKFISTSITQKDTLLQVAGNLTFHGITKPITFTASTKEAGGKTVVNGKFDVNMTEYGVERPSFMMIATDDALRIELRMVFAH